MDELHGLAEAVGLDLEWRTADGVEMRARDAALRAVLGALGYRAETAAEIRESRAAVAAQAQRPPKMIVTEAGQPTPLPASLFGATLSTEAGAPVAVEGVIGAIDRPGYYRLVIGSHETTLAVAPARAWPVPEGRPWGVSVQIPALRGGRPRPYGDFGNLAEAVGLLAARGADAVMINPVHALFPGNGVGYSPYSPSSRLFLNGAMADPALLGLPAPVEAEGGARIDWQAAMPERLAALRVVFDGLDAATAARIEEDLRAVPAGLARHAVFDALDAVFRPQGLCGWRAWPAEFHDPEGPAVARFAAEHAREVAFHRFVQWLTARGLAACQEKARAGGMSIGLIADLAVGVDPSGSDSWAMRGWMLDGLTIGAPPDPLGPLGQNWMLTGFSPRGLRESGYAPWIEMLRGALRHVGGLRIDHAFGLARLWVIPAGSAGSDGVYLRYPFEDMLRLAALESHLASAVVIAEDLGTAPSGFSEAITRRGLPGMRVMWFERAADHGFIGPQDYPLESVAMTGTHDTPTIAGWWSGTDLDWAEKLGRLPKGSTRAQEEARRDWDRGLLWATFGAPGPRPAPQDTEPVVAAAMAHLGRTRSCLALVPLEDLLALREQPNLPGTIEEHPNWRQRMTAPLADLLDAPAAAGRVDGLKRARAL